MSVSMGECIRTHGVPGALNVLSGAIAGGVCLNAVAPGALCGVVRYIIDVTVPRSGILGGLSSRGAEVALHIIKALASIAVLWAAGVFFTSTPIALLGFCLLTPTINWVFTSMMGTNLDKIVSKG
jgi:hypothetical protein